MNFPSTSADINPLQLPLQSLLKTLNLCPDQGEIPENLLALLEPIAFELGDVITMVPGDDPSNGKLSHSDVYWVCQGRVRLLTVNAAAQPIVSVQLCQEASTFGGGRTLANPYVVLSGDRR